VTSDQAQVMRQRWVIMNVGALLALSPTVAVRAKDASGPIR
jgi:hypothetical protein